MYEIISSDLPAIPSEQLIFHQMVSETIIPLWDTLSPNVSIQSIVEKVLNPEIYPDIKPESIIKSSETQKIVTKRIKDMKIIGIKEDMDKVDEMDMTPIEEMIKNLDNPRIEKGFATKSQKEVIEMIGHKIEPPKEEPKEEPKHQEKKTRTREEHDMETMLTGELIALNKDVSQRLQWYNDIDFGHIRSIVEKKSLKKKIIKFETQTIDSYMNKYKKLYDLLSHHGYEIEMLSSNKDRTYHDIEQEFDNHPNLLQKISLVDEMKMISSSWLPKEQTFSRRKRITPVISGKTKSSADKSEA